MSGLSFCPVILVCQGKNQDHNDLRPLGEVLFESNNANIGWDGTCNGKTAKEGISPGMICFKHTDSDKKSFHSGHLTLFD